MNFKRHLNYSKWLWGAVCLFLMIAVYLFSQLIVASPVKANTILEVNHPGGFGAIVSFSHQPQNAGKTADGDNGDNSQQQGATGSQNNNQDAGTVTGASDEKIEIKEINNDNSSTWVAIIIFLVVLVALIAGGTWLAYRARLKDEANLIDHNNGQDISSLDDKK